MKIQKQIDVRLSKKIQTSSLRVVQFDTGIQLVFNVLDFDLPVGTTATLYVRKKSGKFVYQEKGISVSGNTVTVDLENQAITEHGETFYQLRFLNGTDAISTFSSFMMVDPSLADADAVESKTVIAAFEELTQEQIEQIQAATLVEIAKLQRESQDQQKAIADKGIEVLATIPADYTATHNMADEAIRTKADAIVCVAEGDLIVVGDSSDDHLRGLKLLGKTEQFTTTGKNLLNVSLVSGTYSGLTVTVSEDGKITAKGTAAGGPIYLQKGLTLEPGTYTFSVGNDVQFADQNGIWIYGGGVQAFFRNEQKITFTVAEEAVVDVYLFPTKGAAWDVTIYPQIEVGNTATAYEPYTGGAPSPNPEYPQALNSTGSSGRIVAKVAGANLFDVNNATFRDGNGLTGTINADGSITVNGTPTGAYSQVCSGTMKLPKGKYFVSGGENAAGCAYFQLYANIVGGGQKYAIDGVFEVDGTEDGDVHYSIQSGNILDPIANYTLYPMFNVGEKQMDFEPYKSSGTITLQIPNGLPGVPVSGGGNYTDANGQQWICDEVDLEHGVYVQRIGVYTNDGDTSTWGINQQNDTTIIFMTQTPCRPIEATKQFFNMQEFNWTISINSRQNSGAVGTSGIMYCIRAVADFPDVATFKTHLSETPLVCVYPLATPVETALTAEEIEAFKAICGNNPNTTVLNDAGAWMQVKYNADLQKYLDGIIAMKLADLQIKAASRITEISLLASKWTGTASPYSQVVSIEGITEYSQVNLTPSVEQLSIFHMKDLTFVTENEGGVVTVYAIGDKPTADYTMQAQIIEVSV